MSSQQQINPEIFKAYDVRGIYPTELNEETAYRIGRAFVQYLGVEQVAVGRDMRVSSPAHRGGAHARHHRPGRGRRSTWG